MDSIALEPGADHMKLPDWTTGEGGHKYGLDSKNIYIAGLKIPAAVLALIPLQGANESKAFNHADQLLADLRQAAVRAGNAAEFKDAIKELRKQGRVQRGVSQGPADPARQHREVGLRPGPTVAGSQRPRAV